MKHCKGCNANYICLYKWSIYSEICPCPTCLIKMICSVVCDPFEDFKIKTKDRIFRSRYGPKGNK